MKSDNFIKDAMTPLYYVDANGEKQELNPESLLTFNKNNIPFENQATKYFTVARLSERTNLLLKEQETKLDTLYSELYVEYLSDENLRGLNGGKKPSEALLASAIKTDNRYLEAKNYVDRVDYKAKILTWLRKAMETKSNLMQSASAEIRSQQKMNPTSAIPVTDEYSDISNASSI